MSYEKTNTYAIFSDIYFYDCCFNLISVKQNNMTINLSFNFAQRLIALNLQNTDSNQAALVYDLIKERFPYEVGFTEQELQDKSAKINKLLKDAEIVSETSETASYHLSEIESVLGDVKKNLETAKSYIDETNNLKLEIQTHKKEAESSLQEAQDSMAEINNLKSQVRADQNRGQVYI